MLLVRHYHNSCSCLPRTNYITFPGLWNQPVCVLVAQSCLTLCNPMDCSLPGSSVCGILQARILEWVPMPFSSRSQPAWAQIPTQQCPACVFGWSFCPYFLSFLISKMAIIIVQKMVSQCLPCYSGMISLARPCSGYFTHEEDNAVLSLDVGIL